MGGTNKPGHWLVHAIIRYFIIFDPRLSYFSQLSPVFTLSSLTTKKDKSASAATHHTIKKVQACLS